MDDNYHIEQLEEAVTVLIVVMQDETLTADQRRIILVQIKRLQLILKNH